MVANKKPTKPKKQTKPEYWFASKTYGWGWGRATTWQGWLVYAGFLGIFIWYGIWANDRVLMGDTAGLGDEQFFVVGLSILVAVTIPTLVAICLLKGEPPKWRWGNKNK
jgi:hypothetical protein